MRLRLGAAAVLLLAARLFAQTPADLEAGKEVYALQCLQCHGDDGDAVSHVDIVPVAGINHRYPREVIAQLSGAFSGRVLTGNDRERVVEYMRTLRGAKGFADPGWVITPHTVERKAPRVAEFRIIDTRSPGEYRAGHISNAVSADPGDCLASPSDTAEWLGRLGVTPSTVVVVYDEQGGPAAACAWWRIRRAGHQWVSVLDGGLQRFRQERRFVTTVVPKIEAASYEPAASGIAARSGPEPSSLSPVQQEWQWRQTLDASGFVKNEELLRLVETAGFRAGASYRIAAPPAEVAHLLLVLHLVGYQAEYEAAGSVLSVRASGPG
jgi:mono/diheme cytochrome c family protein